MKNDYIANLYPCSDLATVTTLAMFFPIEAIDRSDPQRAVFMFRRDEGLDDLIKQYHMGSLRVNPTAFFQQLRTIKARLYEDG